jgi:hypothetical protein
VSLWGRIRTGDGRRAYRLRIQRGGTWTWLGGTRTTDARGVLSVRLRIPAGALVQVYSLRDRVASLAVRA